AAGSGNSAIEMTIPELEKYSNYTKWIDIAKDWE
ncbi:MAG: YbaK/EbsC family protein, partial [Peptostreptococcus sp.]|nr:YbaK/EbsC family protein [Peptostreptococcus sp.]